MGLMATRSTGTGQFRAVGLLGVAAAVMMCATACDKGGQTFMEGPALADCGQQIGNSSIESTVNFTPGGVAEPNSVIELVGNCDVGVQVAISGPGFKAVGGITTKDGAYQAVAVSFGGSPGPNGTLTVSRHGRPVGQMTVLSRWIPPSSGQPNFCDPLDPHNYGSLPKNYCPPGWRMG
jgi:hypothetical protein